MRPKISPFCPFKIKDELCVFRIEQLAEVGTVLLCGRDNSINAHRVVYIFLVAKRMEKNTDQY
jgi:hypothetical protein